MAMSGRCETVENKGQNQRGAASRKNRLLNFFSKYFLDTYFRYFLDTHGEQSSKLCGKLDVGEGVCVETSMLE
jgi:hypothetical protein